jgi:hypothetical protein
MIQLSNEEGTAPPALPTHYDYDAVTHSLVVTYGHKERVRYFGLQGTEFFLMRGNPRRNYEFLNVRHLYLSEPVREADDETQHSETV